MERQRGWRRLQNGFDGESVFDANIELAATLNLADRYPDGGAEAGGFAEGVERDRAGAVVLDPFVPLADHFIGGHHRKRQRGELRQRILDGRLRGCARSQRHASLFRADRV